MAKSIGQVLQEVESSIAELKSAFADLGKRVTLLETKVGVLEDAPVPRRGAKVPPTKLPETLQELEIGKNPKGT